ncbi:MAG: T9SS type A sorting domain-containing protein [Chitinophagaceae bacterium]
MKRKSTLYFLLFMPFFCMSQNPGGVSSNLKLWVKANTGVSTAGSNVTDWIDQTTTNDFAKLGTGNPTLQTAALNYNPTVVFNGTTRFTGNTTINNITHGFAIGKIENPANVNGSGALIGSSASAGSDYFFHTQNATPALFCSSTNPTVQYTGANGSSNSIGYSLFSEDMGRTPGANDVIRLNGKDLVNDNGGDPVPYNAIPTLGSRATQNIIVGSELAEAILYDASLSFADRNKVESYLAMKYGITLSNSGSGTNGDYTSSSGTLIWDADNGSAYHHNVIGIAKDDNSALLQKQSHQSDDSTRIYISALAASNTLNAGTFGSDGQFVMMGHNNLNLRHTSGNIEYPSGQGIYSRLDREWKITNTNFDGTFSLDIKPNATSVTASDLRILIDDDGDFSNSTLFNPTITYSTGIITITGISNALIPVDNTRYLTIVSLSPMTPLPVSLTDFTANLINNNKYVQLNWKTISENNNDYFTIERSANALQWQEIGRLSGARNSSQLLVYTFTDKAPLPATNYYRLKQTDIDGNFSISDVTLVKPVPQPGKLMVYPNPARNEVIIDNTTGGHEKLSVISVTGKDLTTSVNIILLDANRTKMDISNLPPGIYFIKSASGSFKIYKK